jgi:hypothetical protein
MILSYSLSRSLVAFPTCYHYNDIPPAVDFLHGDSLSSSHTFIYLNNLVHHMHIFAD